MLIYVFQTIILAARRMCFCFLFIIFYIKENVGVLLLSPKHVADLTITSSISSSPLLVPYYLERETILQAYYARCRTHNIYVFYTLVVSLDRQLDIIVY